MPNTDTKECGNCNRRYPYKSYLDKSWHEEKPYHCLMTIQELKDMII